jgi:hypothetical protein
MTLSTLILSVTMAAAQYSGYGAPIMNEDHVRACVQACVAQYDAPNYELKACVAKCQELGSK